MEILIPDVRVRVKWIRDGVYGCPGSNHVMHRYAGEEMDVIRRVAKGYVTYWTDYDVDFAYIFRDKDVRVIDTYGVTLPEVS